MNIYGRYAAISFTINGKAYVGLGQLPDGTRIYDFWEYDPSTNVWTKKADYPGGGSYAATAFAINGKGYICLGANNLFTICQNDLWEYTLETNTWLQKAGFPGTARYGASCFVTGETAFVSTGSYGSGSNYLFDMWMYDPGSNSWSQKANFPGNKRSHATAFTLENFGYVGTGFSSPNTPASDFWKYDKSNDSWSRIPDLPGSPRAANISLVINNKAYLGTGYDGTNNYNSFYAYDPTANSWSSLISVPGDVRARRGAIGFSINNIGYLGTGITDSGPYADLWAFDPSSTSGIIEKNNTIGLKFNPNQITSCPGNPVTLTASGAATYLWNGNFGNTSSITVSPESTTSYTVTGTIAGCTGTESITVTVNPYPIIRISASANSVCAGTSATLTATGAASYVWSPANELSSTTGAEVKASPSVTTPFKVTGSDDKGCSGTNMVIVNVKPKPKVSVNPSSAAICTGTSIDLTVTGNADSYLWSPTAGLSSSTSANVVANPSLTTDYTVTGKDLAGCSEYSTIHIAVNPKPTITDITSKCEPGMRTYFTGLKSSGDQVSAKYGLVTKQNNLFIINNIPGKTSNTIVSTISLTGCKDSVEVQSPSCNSDIIRVPEGFSPNDDGINDFFEISGIDELPDSELLVFNRNGQQVYNNRNYGNDWDGSCYDSNNVKIGLLPNGTYFYVLKLIGKARIIKGFVYIAY